MPDKCGKQTCAELVRAKPKGRVQKKVGILKLFGRPKVEKCRFFLSNKVRKVETNADIKVRSKEQSAVIVTHNKDKVKNKLKKLFNND